MNLFGRKPLEYSHPGAYLLYCSGNGCIYVGSTANLTRRWSYHYHSLRRGIHPSKPMQAACEQFGLDTFHFFVVARVLRNEAFEVEQKFLDLLWGTGVLFNVYPGADNNWNRSLPPETRKKISDSLISKHDDLAIRRRIEARRFRAKDPQACREYYRNYRKRKKGVVAISP